MKVHATIGQHQRGIDAALTLVKRRQTAFTRQSNIITADLKIKLTHLPVTSKIQIITIRTCSTYFYAFKNNNF